MKRYLPFILVAIVAIAAIAGGVMLLRAKRAAVLTTPLAKLGPASAAETVHALGPDKAPVVLEEFGDFQCPPCGKLSEPLNDLERKFHGRLRIIYRNFPLMMHANARAAAATAEAAGLQGRFWEMHDLLYREQNVWSKVKDPRPLFRSYAALLKLDLGRFSRDVDSEEVRSRITRDEERGKAAGVSVTPSIFINNKRVSGPGLSPDGLREEIEKALNSQTPSS